MPTDRTTDHYEMQVSFKFTECNKFGDNLFGNSISYTRNVRARNIGELGQIMSRLETALMEEQ